MINLEGKTHVVGAVEYHGYMLSARRLRLDEPRAHERFLEMGSKLPIQGVCGSAVRVVRCGAGENFEFGAFWDLKIIVTV